LVLMQKGGGCECIQNECTLHKTAICTSYWAICC